MENRVKIFIENNQSPMYVNMGTSLLQVSLMISSQREHPFLACYVNNKLFELSYKIYSPISIRFIDITHFEGMRVYQRTLFFIVHKACIDLFPNNTLHLKHSVAKGYYCELDDYSDISNEDIKRLYDRMTEIVGQDIPIVRETVMQTEAEEIYTRLGFKDKLSLIRTRPSLYVSVYNMAGLYGYFYGAMTISTGYIKLFSVRKYYKGFYLGIPKRTDPSTLEKMISQDKMFDIFNEYTNWANIIGLGNIGALNEAIMQNMGNEMIKVAEALHEKKLGKVADDIFKKHTEGGGRIILISGPSASGKTTFAKRLGVQLRVLGLKPVLISLDDYFVEREKTPLDPSGEYDYEALEAIDVEMFGSHLQELLAGGEVAIPRYDFITGKREYNKNPLKLHEKSVLVVEGIHGLNPKVSAGVDPVMCFKMYVSALTSIALDNVNRIPTTDNRLLRRMVRDARTRGASATDTLRRWQSVRRGEDEYIFPYQEQADIMFNTSLFYEIAVLRENAEQLLHEVQDIVPEYGEARRLLKFLRAFAPMNSQGIGLNSILREFIGGSNFDY